MPPLCPSLSAPPILILGIEGSSARTLRPPSPKSFVAFSARFSMGWPLNESTVLRADSGRAATPSPITCCASGGRAETPSFAEEPLIFCNRLIAPSATEFFAFLNESIISAFFSYMIISVKSKQNRKLSYYFNFVC